MSIPQTTAAAEPDPATATVSAVYVDTENLQPPAGSDDVEFAQSLIAHIVLNWPVDYPPIGLLTLYVPADKSSQWRIWASGLMPEPLATPSGGAGIGYWRQPLDGVHSDRLRVRGVQHFSRSGSKNSADMAIVLDAFDD